MAVLSYMCKILNQQRVKERGPNDTWKFSQDMDGLWRWRRLSPSGNVVGEACDGFKVKADCFTDARKNGYKG